MRPWLFVLVMVPCVCSALLLLLIAYVEVARSFRDRRRSQERAKRIAVKVFARSIAGVDLSDLDALPTTFDAEMRS